MTRSSSLVDQGKWADVIFLDFSNMYDTVSHGILLDKTSILQLDKCIVWWLWKCHGFFHGKSRAIGWWVGLKGLELMGIHQADGQSLVKFCRAPFWGQLLMWDSSQTTSNLCKTCKFFTKRVVRHWLGQARAVVTAPSLWAFKRCLYNALRCGLIFG